MEYYTYSTIHNLLIHKKISSLEEWTKVFEILKFVLNDFKEYKLLKDTEVVSDLKNIYLDKTERRLSLLEQDETFKKFFENDIVINGVTYKNLNEIKSTLLKEIEKLLLTPRQFSILHGDLCFPNIIIDTTLSFVKLIDPRGSFGKFDIFGDTLYDYAKVFHSIDGKYDFIIEDMFTLVYDLSANVVNFKVLDNLDVDLVEIYKKTFKGEKGFDFKKIQLIEAILFLTMIPLHSESLEHQLVFLGTGIEILNKVVDIRK